MSILIIQKDGKVVATNPKKLNFVSTNAATFSVVESPIKTAQISLYLHDSELLLVEPNGEQFASGSLINIFWNEVNVPSVDLFYSFDGNNWLTIATGSIGTSYNWLYPGGNLGGNTYVKVQESPKSSINSFTEIGAVLAAPTLLTPVNGMSSGSINPAFSWTSVIGASSYQIEVATDIGFTNVVVNATGAGTSYSVSGLSILTPYYWRVNASNIITTSPWSTIFNFTTGTNVPDAPSVLSPANNAIAVALVPVIGWTVAPGVLSYGIQISSSSIFFGTPLVDVSGIVTEPWTSNVTLPADTNCYLRINATNLAGTSNWSISTTFQTLYYAPQTPIFNSTIMTLPTPSFSPLLSGVFTNSGDVYAWAGSIEATTTQIYLCKYNSSLQTWTNVSTLSINSAILGGTNVGGACNFYYSNTTPTKFYIEAFDFNTGHNYQCSFTVNFSTNAITLSSAFAQTGPAADAVDLAGIITTTNAGITYTLGSGYITWSYNGENGVYITDSKINHNGGNYSGISVVNNITHYVGISNTYVLSFISLPAYSPV